ncbi:35321_t:CDS:2, partial [Racocetra persica]
DITTEVMAAIYKEITINTVASILLNQFSDSISDLFKVFCDSFLSVRTLAKYSIPVQDILNVYNMSTKVFEQNITGAELFSRKYLKSTYFSHLDDVTTTIERARTICIGDEKFGSISSRSNLNSYIIHCVQVPKEVTIENSRVQIDFKTVEHLFAFVDWYKASSCCDHFYIYNRKTDYFQFDE